MPRIRATTPAKASTEAGVILARVPCIRFGVSSADSRMIFGQDGQGGRSLFDMVDGLWRGAIGVDDIVPLEIVVSGDRICSLSTRRLAALKMLQALKGKELLWARCTLHESSSGQRLASSAGICDGLDVHSVKKMPMLPGRQRVVSTPAERQRAATDEPPRGRGAIPSSESRCRGRLSCLMGTRVHPGLTPSKVSQDCP